MFEPPTGANPDIFYPPPPAPPATNPPTVDAVVTFRALLVVPFSASLRIAVSAFQIIFSLICCLALSILCHNIFVAQFVPKAHFIADLPLEFDTSGCTTVGRSLSRCSVLAANVALPRYKTYPRYPVMVSGQGYTVSVLLDVPETQSNRDEGMVIVCLRFLDQNGDEISQAHRQVLTSFKRKDLGQCRTTMLQYKSDAVNYVSAVLFWPAYASGWRKEAQGLELLMDDSFEVGPEITVTSAHLTIDSRSFQVFSAQLRLDTHFGGLSWYVSEWPMMTAIVSVSVHMVILITTLGAVVTFAHFRPRRG